MQQQGAMDDVEGVVGERKVVGGRLDDLDVRNAPVSRAAR